MRLKKPFSAPYYIRDLANGIQQKRLCWEQNASQPEGTCLLTQSFKRSLPLEAQGTRHYRLHWQNGDIKIEGSWHGWHGWHGSDEGFTSTRRLAPPTLAFRTNAHSNTLPERAGYSGLFTSTDLNPHKILQLSRTILRPNRHFPKT